jgi:hypothetical protein
VNHGNIVPNNSITAGGVKPMCMSDGIPTCQPENPGSTYDCHLTNWVRRRVLAKKANRAAIVDAVDEPKVQGHDQSIMTTPKKVGDLFVLAA